MQFSIEKEHNLPLALTLEFPTGSSCNLVVVTPLQWIRIKVKQETLLEQLYIRTYSLRKLKIILEFIYNIF